MRNVSEVQRWMIANGFLAPRDDQGNPNDDGVFGPISLAAYNRARQSRGLPPHQGMLLLTEINAVLFPEEQPVPTPKKPNFFEAAGVVVTLVNILKGKAMNWNDLQQVVRIVAYAAAGWLGAKGGLDPANVETLGGAIVALVSVAWWFFWNRKAAK